MTLNSIPSTVLNNAMSPSLPTSTKNLNDEKLMKVSKDFESIFLSKMFKEMSKTSKPLTGKDMFHGGMGEDIFKEMLYDKYASESTDQHSLGLAKMVYNSFNKGK